jgi:hypothetical protein
MGRVAAPLILSDSIARALAVDDNSIVFMVLQGRSRSVEHKGKSPPEAGGLFEF